jgi:hypothetical protein
MKHFPEYRRPPEPKQSRDQDHPPQGHGKAHIKTLHCSPRPACPALIVVDCDEQLASGADQPDNVVQCLPHRTRVMEDAPGIDNVELAQAIEEIPVQNGPLLDPPLQLVGTETVTQPQGTIDTVGVIIKGHNLRAEPARGKAEEAAARASIQESLVIEVVDLKHFLERFFGTPCSLGIEDLEESRPIFPETKSSAQAEFALPFA